jgi:hypothetical protein
MRQLGQARAKPKLAKPTTETLSRGITPQQFQQEILPRLFGIPLSEMERATGLSNASCSRIVRGLQIPHPWHWPALSALTTADRDLAAPVVQPPGVSVTVTTLSAR